MSEQLDIFGGNSVVQVGPSKVAKAEKAVRSTTANKPRPGVCECGSGKFKLSVRKGVWTRKCQRETCGKEITL